MYSAHITYQIWTSSLLIVSHRQLITSTHNHDDNINGNGNNNNNNNNNSNSHNNNNNNNTSFIAKARDASRLEAPVRRVFFFSFFVSLTFVLMYI
jgi:hypothetical protein